MSINLSLPNPRPGVQPGKPQPEDATKIGDYDVHWINYTDPIPEANFYFISKYGTQERWENAVKTCRRTKLDQIGKADRTLEKWGVKDKRSTVEWRNARNDLSAAKAHLVVQMEQLNTVIKILDANLSMAETLGIDSFQVDMDIRVTEITRKEKRKLERVKVTEKAERGLEFFDRIMRQAPRPGTIAQKVS